MIEKTRQTAFVQETRRMTNPTLLEDGKQVPLSLAEQSNVPRELI